MSSGALSRDLTPEPDGGHAGIGGRVLIGAIEAWFDKRTVFDTGPVNMVGLPPPSVESQIVVLDRPA